MARETKYVVVGKQRLELSNLEKILFPQDRIIKAEVVQYYMQLAPDFLLHSKNRPLSLVRFPDGVDKQSFFQKNRPDWAPDWVKYVTLGKEKKDYIMATEAASLVWLANLACLEIHQIHSQKPHFDEPDYFVFDLDPPEGYVFERLLPLAGELRNHLESFGYYCFVKTTGGKGVHLLCPILPKNTFEEVFEAVKEIAQRFVETHNKTTTLHIKKDARKGRVLIDIYRNRPSQTIVSPYSLRGRAGAPVSMPLPWETLFQVKNPLEFNLNTVPDYLASEGDAWEGMAAFAVELHTHRTIGVDAAEVPVSPHYKTPEQLSAYAAKRKFSHTPEPMPGRTTGNDNAFVVHRHHASHMHYDLRLEQNGTLRSWAVPRGMPPQPGIKRLAVATEDHPLEYLNFEGSIPKGQYGGGDMWIFATGRYEITKQKKDGFYFKLISRELTGEYRIYQIKEKEWLLERLDEPRINYTQEFIAPMLANSMDKPPLGENLGYEVKWDGIRAMIAIDEGKIKIWSRNARDVTAQFPELDIGTQAFRTTSALFDGEIVCLDKNGKADFNRVIKRLLGKAAIIEHSGITNPVSVYLFDCVYLDGRFIGNEPLARRREWLKDAVRPDTPYRVSEMIAEGQELFEAAKRLGVEGIMAKTKEGRYLPGKRSEDWVKVKIRKTADCVIIGYTEVEGERAQSFGALQIAEKIDGKLYYRGKVGTGFTQSQLKEIKAMLKKLNTVKKYLEIKVQDEKKTQWVSPKIYCEIQYAQLTSNDTFREPIFYACVRISKINF